jgi:hypothetical protein
VSSLTTARRVAAYLWPKFVERDGAILPAFVRAPEPPDTFATLTEFERFHGHTHINDLFEWRVRYRHDAELDLDRPDPTTRGFAEAWDFAQKMGRMWMAKLRVSFPRYRFRVYVSKLDDPIIHYHRVRRGEQVWISDREAAAQIECGEMIIYDSRVITG